MPANTFGGRLSSWLPLRNLVHHDGKDDGENTVRIQAESIFFIFPGCPWWLFIEVRQRHVGTNHFIPAATSNYNVLAIRSTVFNGAG